MSETDPRKLESYLERAEAYDGSLEPEVERLVDALHEWQHEASLQPRAGFVNEVADQLHRHAARRRTIRSWPSRILAGAMGAVALVVFGFIVIGLFSRGENELPVGEEAHLDLGKLESPLVHPPTLPLVDYPPSNIPYLIEYGDFWLVHNPEGNLLAFVPVSPEYRENVPVEACRFTWNVAVGRFVDPCSGDEWELDGTLNLAHSPERWSNRDLDQYALTVQEGTLTVHLDQVITGAARADTPLDSSATAAPATPTRLAAPYGYSGITVTLQDVSSTQYEIDVSLRIEIAADPAAGEVTGASLAYPGLVDEQGNQYEPRIGTANSQTTVDGLLVDVTQSHQPGALGAKTLTLKTGLELRAKASSALSLDLRGRQPGDRWPVDHTVEIYGLVVPIEEVALVTDPGAPPGSLSLQVMAPCVNEAGVELVYLEMLAEGAARQGDGQGGNPCGDGQERLVSTLTVESMLDGSAPGELESVVLQLAGRLHLPGPWELSWEVDE